MPGRTHRAAAQLLLARDSADDDVARSATETKVAGARPSTADAVPGAAGRARNQLRVSVNVTIMICRGGKDGDRVLSYATVSIPSASASPLSCVELRRARVRTPISCGRRGVVYTVVMCHALSIISGSEMRCAHRRMSSFHFYSERYRITEFQPYDGSAIATGSQERRPGSSGTAALVPYKQRSSHSIYERNRAQMVDYTRHVLCVASYASNRSTSRSGASGSPA